METVIVERTFETTQRFETLQQAEDAVAWCLTLHGVRFRHSYLARDGLSMVCVYEAPDAEAVRITQRKGGLPFERAWAAHVLATEPRLHAPEGRSTILVEREFPAAVAPADAASQMAQAGPRLALHRAEHLVSYLSRDGTRMVCVFDALDADSVRMANRSLGVPVARTFPATFHGGV